MEQKGVLLFGVLSLSHGCTGEEGLLDTAPAPLRRKLCVPACSGEALSLIVPDFGANSSLHGRGSSFPLEGNIQASTVGLEGACATCFAPD